jgi:tetratricopeptide (TPR) repeat protein
MSEIALFPSYVARPEQEREILRQSEQVRRDRQTRAVLVYGPGGVGKTWLVRNLAEAHADDPHTIWVGPIDSDDSQFWLLSNLEQLIARKLDPGDEHQYFRPYFDYLSRLPRFAGHRAGHETVLSNLGRIKRVFLDCYQNFVNESGRTVVILFDTVEAIRGMDLLVTLTQLMKALPATLFILSGRPQPDAAVRPDPIKSQLEDPHQNISVTTITMEDFTEQLALEYLNESSVATALTGEEKARLVRLTRGHPLWLAFTVSYLNEWGLPEEATRPLKEIEAIIPYRGKIPHIGRDLQESFNRHLVAPYRGADFWHEAIKRLAVARESISLPIWCQFMADRPPPDGITELEQAWPVLLQIPWIRTRANSHLVTLHDAVAEELAQRIIPMHDEGTQWRRELWRRAAGVYAAQIAVKEQELASGQASLADVESSAERSAGVNGVATGDERQMIDEIAALDVQHSELSQYKAVRLYYQILWDFSAGCRLFLELMAQAAKDQDLLFQDLLAFEMERFLPGGATYAFGDVIGDVIGEFRDWLGSQAQDLYLEVGIAMADYLIRSEQPGLAIDMLDRLPAAAAGHRESFRMNNLRGNALMRVPGRVKESLPRFKQALTEARAIQSSDGPKLVAKSYKELGFYYRNEGQMSEADDAYRSARDTISATLSADSTDDDREEMASIQTNWAYLKGLSGDHREGISLVASAIGIRHRLTRVQEEGISWSVAGEVYRYERRFQMAWRAYLEAEQIFQELRNWSWLGVLYQEQAICLFQAVQDDIELIPGRDSMGQAKRLVTLALDLCRDLAIRSYPSALNRAGRIYGHDNAELGLAYLDEGIRTARELSDGWFWFANLIEYVELNYRLWAEDGRQPVHLEQIRSRMPEIVQAMAEYEFPDLKGRWDLVQGHLAIGEWRDTGEATLLDTALGCYRDGFAQIAQQHVGSSGAASIAGEFRKFRGLIWHVPSEIRAQWHDEFRRAWSGAAGSTLLLAGLEELY